MTITLSGKPSYHRWIFEQKQRLRADCRSPEFCKVFGRCPFLCYSLLTLIWFPLECLWSEPFLTVAFLIVQDHIFKILWDKVFCYYLCWGLGQAFSMTLVIIISYVLFITLSDLMGLVCLCIFASYITWVVLVVPRDLHI